MVAGGIFRPSDRVDQRAGNCQPVVRNFAESGDVTGSVPGEILHQDAETVGIGHQQIQLDVQAYGSGIQTARRDLQQRSLVRGQYLVGKLFPFLPEDAFLLLFGQGGKVFERDAAGRDRRQRCRPSGVMTQRSMSCRLTRASRAFSSRGTSSPVKSAST